MSGEQGQDKFQAFKANVALQNEYREAYEALRARDREAVKGLTHPDEAPQGFDYGAALEAIKGAGGGLKADPRMEIRG